MSDNSKTRPVFIKATNVHGLVMRNNIVSGDADFAHINNAKDVESSGNIHTAPAPDISRVKAWYERPFGIVVLGLAVAVVAGGILHWLGWV